MRFRSRRRVLSPRAWKKRSILKLFFNVMFNVYALPDASARTYSRLSECVEVEMSDRILDSVKSKYGAVAESALSSDHAGVKAVAEAFGYTAEELTSIPAG